MSNEQLSLQHEKNSSKSSDKQTPDEFERQLLHLDTQNRPKVIVYAEGKSKISPASSRADFYPETEPQVHVCPM
jgi:putative transposase